MRDPRRREAAVSRAAGEVVRLRAAVSRARAMLDALEIAVESGHEVLGAEAAQAVAGMGLEIAMGIAKHDAYMVAERDAGAK